MRLEDFLRQHTPRLGVRLTRAGALALAFVIGGVTLDVRYQGGELRWQVSVNASDVVQTLKESDGR